MAEQLMNETPVAIAVVAPPEYQPPAMPEWQFWSFTFVRVNEAPYKYNQS